ncbi:MAG: NUDIX domain-containing protein [Vicinamibacteria bacterium]
MEGARVFGTPEPGAVVVARPAAYAIVRDAAGRVAVVHEDSGLFLPGGGREPGETAEENVRREVREEVGCGFHILRRLAEAVQFCRAHDRDGWYETRAVFFAGAFVGEPAGGACVLEWLTPADARARLHHASHAWAVALPVE